MKLSAEKSYVFEFADLRLDIGERELVRTSTGERIPLPDKAFDTLCVLVRNAGRLVGKDELISHVWGDTNVEENNLNKSIHAIRRAIGENNGGGKLIETVKKHGYRFLPEVRTVDDETGHGEAALSDPVPRENPRASIRKFPHLVPRGEPSSPLALAPSLRPVDADFSNPADTASPELAHQIAQPSRRRVYPALIAAAIVLVAVVGFAIYKYRAPAAVNGGPGLTTLAVLPLRPIDASDNFLGLGVADAIIRRISQTSTLTVRPTSSVRRYLNGETDALAAANELGVDAVLEGTVQRADDRLRISVNLLRASDGKSLWAENYDMRTADVFAIQDQVAQQVAGSLRMRLDSPLGERLTDAYTPNAIAYEYYLKGLYSFDQRGFNHAGKPQHEATIALFKKSIEADPNYAPAHALLAYAYAWMGIYVDEQDQDGWVELAKQEIDRADALDPQLAETHIARHHVLLSAHEGYQTENAARELILAKKLNPNVAGIDLAVAYNHLGLEDMFDKEKQRTLEIDPTSEFNKMIFGFQLLFAKRYDDWLAYRQKYFDGKPDVPYLMGTGRVAEAEQLFDQLPAHGWDAETSPSYKTIMLALKGDRRGAEAGIPVLINTLPYKTNHFHHAVYDLACVNALLGHSAEAVKWLRETARTGFPSYPMFERDHLLDPIRQAPEFVEFMADMRTQNEKVRREFAASSE